MQLKYFENNEMLNILHCSIMLIQVVFTLNNFKILLLFLCQLIVMIKVLSFITILLYFCSSNTYIFSENMVQFTGDSQYTYT